MKNKLHFTIVLSVVVIIFIILAKGLFKTNSYVPNSIQYDNFYKFKSKEFYTNDEFILENLLNRKKFTIINIWASWCKPCRDEHIFLMNLSKTNRFTIIGINYKDKFNNAKKFLNELGNPYEIILKDPNGIKSIELGAYGVPETFILNNELKVVMKKYIGPIDKKRLKEILKLVK
tara:strand:+ start:2133 stop:2657 length:525 start_codon:yes stop_codon:yes gene_type:complete